MGGVFLVVGLGGLVSGAADAATLHGVGGWFRRPRPSRAGFTVRGQQPDTGTCPKGLVSGCTRPGVAVRQGRG